MDHVYFEISRSKAPPELLNNPSNLVITDRAKLLASSMSFLETQGYFDKGGITIGDVPRPLLTLPFLDFLSCLDLSNETIVELGAGQSTLYFQERYKAVHSYETSLDWIELLKARLRPNVQLQLETTINLEACRIDLPEHDWLLIDFAGKRTAFIHNLLRSKPTELLPNYIVLDNAEWYRKGAGLLIACGYTEVPFVGLKSSQTFTSVTSLFLKRGCPTFTMLEHINPPYSQSVENIWDVIE